MFVEAVLTRDEIRARLEEAFPLLLHLDEPGAGRALALSDLGDVTLVENVGLRVTCKARVQWRVLGIDVLVALRSLGLMVIPRMEPGPFCDILTFHVAIEHATLTGIPSALERWIVAAVNRRLLSGHVALGWDFSTLFGHVLPLPESIEPLDAALLRAAWGQLRIAEDAVAIAVSVHVALLRAGGETPSEFATILGSRFPRLLHAPVVATPAATSAIAGELVAGGLAGLAAVAFYLVARAGFRMAA